MPRRKPTSSRSWTRTEWRKYGNLSLLRDKLLSNRMKRTFKPRLAGFALAIVIVALMIGWAAHASWRQFDQLSRKLTEMQIESFKTADQFRANVQELDYVLLRYTILRDEADRDRFLKEWKKMDNWIDIQRPTLTTDKEGKILDRINAAYDDYFAAATNLLQQVVDRTSDDRPLAAFRKIEDASSSLLGLGYQLVNAHHESLTRFLADSQRSLAILRELIFGALFLLLVLVASLRAAEPVGRAPVHRPDVEVVVDPHHPDRPLASQRPVGSQRRDLQLVRSRDLLELVGRPPGHRSTSFQIVARFRASARLSAG